jgi:type IV pilus assembly protein PilY1
MKLTLPLLAALLLAPLAAQAAPTQIAQLPLLNVTGTGLVKPNLMLLYDNSGSMRSAFTPDYVDDSTSCRKYTNFPEGTRNCLAGYPPFNSPDFNKQYYNPEIQYVPPVKADGSYYPSKTSANTTGWTVVVNDGFGINTEKIDGSTSSTNTNLVSGFPDLKWCVSGSTTNCGFNSATYSFPTRTFVDPVGYTTNAFYFQIQTAEFCSDANLTSCTTVQVGSAAPAGYPYPAKVRFCNSTALTTCQAKYVGAFKYPRFGNENGGLVASYGTVTINSSNTGSALSIASVSVAETGGPKVITNGAVAAPNGTNTAANRNATALSLAASIVAKTGLANQYTACVRTPGTSGVPNCNNYGITLGADNIVAIVPIDCEVGATTKSLTDCTVVTDDSRSGWGVSAVAPTVILAQGYSTAVVNVSGLTNKNNVPVLASMKYGTTTLFTNLSLAKNLATATTVAAAIKGQITNTATLSAYVGGTTGSGTTCQALPATYVCLVDTSAGAGGVSITMGALSNNLGTTNNGTIVFTTTAGTARSPNTVDAIPVATAAMSAGNTVFARVDIVPARTAYPRGVDRADCIVSSNSCTYAEEMTNFANWYSYYKTRNQMMKSAVGRAFDPVSASFKVGIVSLSTAAAEQAMNTPKVFSGTNRSTWYTALYAMNGNNSTPLRQALNAVGKMYANRAPYNYAAGQEVVQYPCEQNFTFMTTDGYWNGGAASNVVSNDEAEATNRYCTLASGCVDPAGQSDNSLADVALYWYNGGFNTYTANTNSLRPTLEDWTKPGLVSGPSGDNRRLHMTTYTLGLGVDGIMTYDADYNRNPETGSDFYNLINRVSSGCPWNGNGAYVWPDPVTSDNGTSAAYQSRVDDLWHAAVNGHGKYFSAANPTQVIDGLRDALSAIESTVGAAAAAATSTPNISQEDNDIFSDTFTTVAWYGELSDKKINIATGEVIPTPVWISSDQVGRKVAAATDTRTLKMLDTASGGLKNFSYAEMTATEKSWFNTKCSLLPQCPQLDAAQVAILNAGENVVNWLRGQQQHADGEIMRSYALTDHTPAGMSGPIPIVLGDIASSKPAFMREPRRNYVLSGYNDFVVANQTRAATVFAAANDGMLHAFRASTGEEIWAYAPRITMKKLFLQTSTRYGTNHQYTTDGSPELADVQIGGVWKTILVAGLNGGGRGYYAIDVTDPANPRALWETCADVSICTGVNNVPDMGLTFGNPQIGMYNNQWVVLVTSGYNNIPGTDGVNSGNGAGWLFVLDPADGHVIQKISTGSGDTTTPSGLAKITAITSNPGSDPVITHVYGGDILGQMWRFDLTSTLLSKTLMGNAGTTQPITTRPDITTCRVSSTTAGVPTSGVVKMVVFGTGRLLDVPDVSNTDLQSIYAIKDATTTINPWRANMVQQTLTALTGGTSDHSYKISNNPVDLSTSPGWYVNLNMNSGERVNLDPQIVAGSVTVVANIPSSSSACSVGGSSNVYQLDVCTGSYINSGSIERIGTDVVAGHTLSGNSAAVGFIMIRLPTGVLKMITTTAKGETLTGNGPPTSLHGATQSGWRTVK